MKSFWQIIKKMLDDMACESLWLRVVVCLAFAVLMLLPGIVIMLIWCIGIDELNERLGGK